MQANRDQVIIRTSIIGIIANVFLAGFKAAVGLVSNSIAVILDAVNNLSDALSSVITIAFSTDLLITIHEGRNRQVRKMIEAVGHQVVRLKRVRFGPVQLGDLPSGMWRKLTDEECTHKQLQELLGNKYV